MVARENCREECDTSGQSSQRVGMGKVMGHVNGNGRQRHRDGQVGEEQRRSQTYNMALGGIVAGGFAHGYQSRRVQFAAELSVNSKDRSDSCFRVPVILRTSGFSVAAKTVCTGLAEKRK